MTDVFIIGKGPAGISASLYAVRAGLETVVCGKGDGALGKADKIENYYGFADAIDAHELLSNGIKGAERLGVKILEEEIFEITFGDFFTITTDKGVHEAKAVIMATGTSRKTPPIKGLKNFEGKGVSYCAVCDAFFYRGRNVSVIGAGRYAASEALHLLPTSAEVTILTNGKPLEDETREMIEDLEKDPAYAEIIGNLKVDTRKVSEIKGDDVVSAVSFAEGDDLETEGVFIAIGTASGADLGRKLGIAGTDGKLIFNPDMTTYIPGFFVAGDCTGGMLQIAKAVYEGALAGTGAVRYVRSLAAK